MARHRLLRLVAGGALAAFTLCISVPAQAQGILGRARDRARQALAGNNQPAGPACSSSDQSRAIAGLSITDDFVTRFLRGLQARQSEIRRIAAENSPTGRYFAATLRRDSLAGRHAMYRSAAQGEQDIEENRAEVPDVPWDQMQAANNRLDEAARQAGGFSACDWGASVDVIPGVVNFIAQDRREHRPARGASDFLVVGRSTGLRESELTVIRAHAAELASALGVDYPSDAELAAAQRAAQRQAAAQATQDSLIRASNAYAACVQRVAGNVAAPMTNVPPDSMRSWETQMEAAEKRGDNAAMMAIAQKMMAMNPGMMQQARAMGEAGARAQQQCGPMPGTPK